MSKTEPPFRADHVGSLLRTPAIFEARERHRSGAIDAAALRAIEDREIGALIGRLADTGIRSITDGEFRREWFHLDFLQQLGGVTVEGMIASTSDSEETVHQAPPRITVTGKLTHDRPIQVADYEFVASHTPDGCLPKVSIPSPTMAHFRGGRAGIDITSYPDLDEFFEDLAQVYRDEIAALYAAGCRYVQLDDTNLAFQNSQIDAQLRLVHTAEVTYTGSSATTALSALRSSTDGKMDEAQKRMWSVFGTGNAAIE